MSIRCGFFNSVNNDRKYDAEDMGRLFEGVISDGVFSSVEPKFEVEPVPETMDLLVNNGKAWFYERYFEIYNPETVSIRTTDINPRIDAICICINTNDSVRAGSIEIIEGASAQNPTKPSMPTEDGVCYIPIAWVTVGANDTVSTDLDIISNIGNATDPVESYRCPYSEPSLDPRRAVYAYEGSGGVDPKICNYRKYQFDMRLDTDIGTSARGKIGRLQINYSDLGFNDKIGLKNAIIIPHIITGITDTFASLFGSDFLLTPLYNFTASDGEYVEIGAKIHQLNTSGSGYVTPCPSATIRMEVVVIDLGGDSNE